MNIWSITNKSLYIGFPGGGAEDVLQGPEFVLHANTVQQTIGIRPDTRQMPITAINI